MHYSMGLDLLLVSGLQTPKTMALFILIGALATGYAASAILRGIRFAKKMQRVGVQALGLIISQRSVQRGGRGNFETYLVPKVRYQLPDGKILEGESAGGGEVEFYDGQEAYLLYEGVGKKKSYVNLFNVPRRLRYRFNGYRMATG